MAPRNNNIIVKNGQRYVKYTDPHTKKKQVI